LAFGEVHDTVRVIIITTEYKDIKFVKYFILIITI